MASVYQGQVMQGIGEAVMKAVMEANIVGQQWVEALRG